MPTVPVHDLRTLSRDMLTLKDLAQYFGISHETARKIARKPGFPLFRSERTLRIPKAAFLTWLAHETRHGED
jgi:hypothetical protein